MTNRKPLPENAKVVFKGVIFEVWQWEQKMFDGTTATFERLKRPDTTTVIPVVGDKILVLQQEQPDKAQSFSSIPGGRSEEGEEPLVSAQRELLEETGYVSDDWTLWREQDPVAKIEWTVYTYIARNCSQKEAPRPDAGERISLRLVTFDEFLALADDPTFSEKELVVDLLKARTDSTAKESLRKLLFNKS